MRDTPWWASEDVWRKLAVFVTAGMFLLLIALSLHSLTAISVGSTRVPDYSVINHRIYFDTDSERGYQVPRIGAEAPLFGQKLSAAEAESLVRKGKLTIQARNCMNCHTLLGNGAYFAPDLTKAWLDPMWGTEGIREEMMANFLLEPVKYARSLGSGRRMPDLKLSEEEVRAIIAYLKWMSSIDTNGFPYGFRVLKQEKQ